MGGGERGADPPVCIFCSSLFVDVRFRFAAYKLRDLPGKTVFAATGVCGPRWTVISAQVPRAFVPRTAQTMFVMNRVAGTVLRAGRADLVGCAQPAHFGRDCIRPFTIAEVAILKLSGKLVLFERSGRKNRSTTRIIQHGRPAKVTDHDEVSSGVGQTRNLCRSRNAVGEGPTLGSTTIATPRACS